MESELVTLIGQFGFPIAISIYLLITRDKTISQNTQAIQELKAAIAQLCEKNKKD